MKKTIPGACVFSCLILSISCLASAQDMLSQGFERARTLPLMGRIADNSASAKLPQAPRAIEPGHELGNVTGTDIAMKVYDHAVAGAVNGAVIWGFFDEAAGSSQLIMRKYGQVIAATFKQQPDNSFGGVLLSEDGSSKRSTSVFFAGADPASRTFKLRINEETVSVSIAAEGIANGHFVNPTYSTVLNGKPVSYRIEAEGCLGYSIQMALIILGAYAH